MLAFSASTTALLKVQKFTFKLVKFFKKVISIVKIFVQHAQLLTTFLTVLKNGYNQALLTTVIVT